MRLNSTEGAGDGNYSRQSPSQSVSTLKYNYFMSYVMQCCTAVAAAAAW